MLLARAHLPPAVVAAAAPALRPLVGALAARCARYLSTGAHPALKRRASLSLFDEDHSDLYDYIFKQHGKPGGPWPMMIEAAVDALPSGKGKILDIASGPGEPAMLIATRLPGAEVLSTDISPKMYEKAVHRAKSLPNVKCELADAIKLPYEDATFDVVTCCHGYMHFDDKEAAFKETARVLKPGGRAIFTHWLKIANMESSRAMMRAVLGEEPPPPPINAHSLANPGVVEDILQQCGMSVLNTATSEYDIEFEAEPGAFKLSMLPIAKALQDVADSGRSDVYEVAEKAFHRHVVEKDQLLPDGHVIMPSNQFRMVVAKKR